MVFAQVSDSLGTIPVEFLVEPSGEKQDEVLTFVARADSWMRPIIDYLQEGVLPSDKLEARRMRARAAIYCIQDNMLYKKGFTTPLLRCIEEPDCRAVLLEIHAGYCCILSEFYVNVIWL